MRCAFHHRQHTLKQLLMSIGNLTNLQIPALKAPQLGNNVITRRSSPFPIAALE